MMAWRGREDLRNSVQGNGKAKTPVPFGGSGTGFSAGFVVSKSESAFLGLRSLNGFPAHSPSMWHTWGQAGLTKSVTPPLFKMIQWISC